MRTRVFGYPHSLIRSFQSAYRISGHKRMYEWRANTWMKQCSGAGWSETAHFAHTWRYVCAWCSPLTSSVRQDLADTQLAFFINLQRAVIRPSTLYKSTAGCYRPVSYPDGPITARCSFIKNAYWEMRRTIRIVRISASRNRINDIQHAFKDTICVSTRLVSIMRRQYM